MDQATAGLIGAAIGAGGAVMTQIIAATFTQRSESKRFVWEQAEAERRDADRQRERFREVEREVFGDYLLAHARIVSALSSLPVPPTGGKRAEAIAAWREQADIVQRAGQQIALISPALDGACSEMRTAGTAFIESVMDGAEAERAEARAIYERAGRECRKAMSAHLGISTT